MTGDTLPNAIYLLLLLMALGGVLVASVRRSPARTLQQLSVWALLFLGLIAVFGMWGDIKATLIPRQQVLADGRVELPREPDGHYYAVAKVNGVPLRFVIDTGATQVVLTRRDAERLGLDPRVLAFTGSASTANGTISTAPVRLDSIDIGPIQDRNVRAVVNGAEMETSLLGMSYLTRFGRVEFDRDRMILER